MWQIKDNRYVQAEKIVEWMEFPVIKKVHSFKMKFPFRIATKIGACHSVVSVFFLQINDIVLT